MIFFGLMNPDGSGYEQRHSPDYLESRLRGVAARLAAAGM
jgi:hypothetical protein